MTAVRALLSTIVVGIGLLAVLVLAPSGSAALLLGGVVAAALVALRRSADDPPAPEAIPVRVDEDRRRARRHRG